MFGSAIGSIGASLVGGLISSSGQDDANAANAEQAQKMMDFQERMSNTSYQRGMADMKKAGLNPMLAYMKGGASTPDGTMAHMENTMKPLGDSVSQSVPQALQARQIVATTANTEANTQKALSEADLASAQTAETQARTPTYASVIGLNQAQIDKINAEIPKITADTSLSKVQADKLNADIFQLSLQGGLTAAQIQEVYARANLTQAQVAEVKPRIDNLIANTAATKAGTGFQQFKSDAAELVHAPAAGKLINSAGSALGEAAGKVRMFFTPDSSRRTNYGAKP